MSPPSGHQVTTTTFFLLRAHEPTDPPPITDASSQAGQAFNQVLRCIAGQPGFHSQLFGWPTPPQVDRTTTDDDSSINMNDYVSSILPSTLAVFVNWENPASAKTFLSPASMKQAFQGFTTFFQVPTSPSTTTNSSCLAPLPSGATAASLAFNIEWGPGQQAQLVLERTRHPLAVRLVSSNADGQIPGNDGQNRDSHAIGTIMGITADNGQFTNIVIENNPNKDLSRSTPNAQEIHLTLMRTRYCSRIKEGLYEMIRSRRVD